MKLTFRTLLAGIFVMVFSEVLMAQNQQTEINWISFEEAVKLAEADEQPKKFLFFMEADWCTLCKKMKKEVFPDSEVQGMIDDNFYAVRIDIESDETITYNGKKWTKEELSKEFGLYATPTIIFLDSDQSLIGNKPGYMDKPEFMELLSFVADGEYTEAEF